MSNTLRLRYLSGIQKVNTKLYLNLLNILENIHIRRKLLRQCKMLIIHITNIIKNNEYFLKFEH